MKASVLHIIMYLFQYHIQNDVKLGGQQEELLPHLEEAGFQRANIIRALNWLTNLQKASEEIIVKPHTKSIRIYNTEECKYINAQCRGFILSLEHQGILNTNTRELLINQVMELRQEDIDLSLIKWVTLLVLFSRQDQMHELEYMQYLVLDESFNGGTH